MAFDVFGIESDGIGKSLEESMAQEQPFEKMFKSIKNDIAGKVGNVLKVLGDIPIGSMPVVGDIVDLYELISGEGFFTGKKLTAPEKESAAFGLLIVSGAAWPEVAKKLDSELASLSYGYEMSIFKALQQIIKSFMNYIKRILKVLGLWLRGRRK